MPIINLFALSCLGGVGQVYIWISTYRTEAQKLPYGQFRYTKVNSLKTIHTPIKSQIHKTVRIGSF